MKTIIVSPRIIIDDYNKINFLFDEDLSNFLNNIKINILPIMLKKNRIELKNVSLADGLILAGGGNIFEYEKNLNNKIRDNYEKKLFKQFFKEDKPILLICRGFQLVTNLYKKKLFKFENHVRKYHHLNLKKSKYIKHSKLIVNSAFPSLYPQERSKLDARIRFDDDSTSIIPSSEVSWLSTNPSLLIENGFASAKNVDSITRVSINASSSGLSAILFIRLKPESSNISTGHDPNQSIENALSDSVNMRQAGWKNSNWFGNYFESDGGWMYHQYHGWLFPITKESSSLWMWSPAQKWLWTNPKLYPHIFRHKDGDWLYFIKQAFPRKAYFNQSSKKLEFTE